MQEDGYRLMTDEVGRLRNARFVMAGRLNAQTGSRASKGRKLDRIIIKKENDLLFEAAYSRGNFTSKIFSDIGCGPLTVLV